MSKTFPTQSSTPLYDGDYVILFNTGEFHSFIDGGIIIYNDKDEAKRDCLELGTSKVISCTALTRRNRKELRKNIRKFSEMPY